MSPITDIVSKQGKAFSRGALYTLLRNRIYRGEIRHRSESFPGQHPAIVPNALWDMVNQRLDAQRIIRRERKTAAEPSVLAGMVFDANGQRLTPAHTVRHGQRYRYYVASINEHAERKLRLPAHALEALVVEQIVGFLNRPQTVVDELGNDGSKAKLLVNAKDLAAQIKTASPRDVRTLLLRLDIKVVVEEEQVHIDVPRRALRASLDVEAGPDPTEHLRFTAPIQRTRRGNEVRWIVRSENDDVAATVIDQSLIRLLARGRQWYDELTSGHVSSMRAIAVREKLSERYVSRALQGSLIDPALIERVLEGRQPATLTIGRLRHLLPSSWDEQRRALGIAR